MKNNPDNTHCKSIFKNNSDISTRLSELWAEVINQSEQTIYTPATEPLSEMKSKGRAGE